MFKYWIFTWYCTHFHIKLVNPPVLQLYSHIGLHPYCNERSSPVKQYIKTKWTMKTLCTCIYLPTLTGVYITVKGGHLKNTII